MTVLIADDERTIREGIASAIDWNALGISRIMLASNGRKARTMIAAEKPDIAIVDIVMPEMTGIELISQCRKEPECPEFVIISGHDEFKYAQEALKHHVHNYILKPCDTAEIANTIRGIVRDLERGRSIETERKALQERLDLVMPQAREELLADFVSGAPVSEIRLQALRQSYGTSERFQLLILYAGERNRHELQALKQRFDAQPNPVHGCLSAVTRDSLVLVLVPMDRKVVEKMAERLRMGQDAGRPDIPAALSAPGGFEDLPQLYRVAYQALKRASHVEGSSGEGFLLEVSSSPYSKTLQKAMRYMEEHFADSTLSLGKMAKEFLFLNGDYVGKLFKKECGLTFSEYLMSVRMEHAKRIIAASHSPRIYEVAWQVGFGYDAAYFGQVFRKYTGVPPGEYRKMCQ